jgi:pyruvate dehydrogenase E1 component beta subunit
LKVVVPATPADAKGLMIAAIRDDNPVLFVEPMSLSHARRAEVPDGDYVVPIGSASVARRGRDVTLAVWGSMLPLGVQAAALMSNEGVEVEIVDLRSLSPWDAGTVVESVRRTRRLVIAHETWVTGSFGAEVAATIAETPDLELQTPVKRVGAAPVPIPSGPLRARALPTSAQIAAAIRASVEGSRP